MEIVHNKEPEENKEKHFKYPELLELDVGSVI